MVQMLIGIGVTGYPVLRRLGGRGLGVPYEYYSRSDRVD